MPSTCQSMKAAPRSEQVRRIFVRPWPQKIASHRFTIPAAACAAGRTNHPKWRLRQDWLRLAALRSGSNPMGSNLEGTSAIAHRQTNIRLAPEVGFGRISRLFPNV